jgi:hypothetical protein
MFSTAFKFFLGLAIFLFMVTAIFLFTVSPHNIRLADLSETEITMLWWVFHSFALAAIFCAFLTILFGMKSILDDLKKKNPNG